MSYPMYEKCDDVETLVGDTGALLESAARAGGKQSREERNGVSHVLERGKILYGMTRRRVIHDTRAADAVIHENLYRTVLVAAGVGLVLGYCLARRCVAGVD